MIGYFKGFVERGFLNGFIRHTYRIDSAVHSGLGAAGAYPAVKGVLPKSRLFETFGDDVRPAMTR